ncbi:MAG: tRNA (adenosine(37)-N6)-dimethylallyltransferase MiaA [Deltaproteobacteria bacterium]|nr:tRNA (adenosine(37)-N6)-dimethylallyltransferase MiaA [Deltaproteobacteria bacterium]MBI4223543.1 tRNA (adenosine(37)-N6)-dimethylallyltransferase MiaA [Deltaproteobacteria bacterium]
MKKIIVLCGPTAVGKSKIALELAQQCNGEIVSADSQQVYQELDIGTAKPTPAERAQVPHHLIDVASPDAHFDVSRYAALADAAIADITKRGRLPIVTGGTGMYIRILLYGLCDAPPQDKAVRQRLMQRIEAEGLKKLYAELKKVDGEAAQKIHPNDKTRIIRALEVHELTGYPLSHFQQKHCFAKPRYEARQVGFNIDRKVLHQNIERRVDWMIANGWVEEVRELLKFYSSACQALQSIGYKQIVRHLKGQKSLPETIEEIKKETRALARRQLTWFRADKNIRWFDPADAGWSRALN